MCFKSCVFVVVVDVQTQEREAKAEMRRKAKELQQARRDAERSGKKVPAFGGFGSGGMTSVSSGSIITDTIVEPEKPKITPAAVRYSDEKHTNEHGLVPLFYWFWPVLNGRVHGVCFFSPFQTKWTQ